MKEKTIVCISCYYKGYDFIDEMKKLGNRVILIVSESTKEKNWPWHAIDEVYYMPEVEPSVWNLDHLVQGFSYLLKGTKIDRVIALDDYDVEKAALLRESFRIPGMGQTTQRYFRDKLAMRQMAKDSYIDIPQFSSIFNDETVNEFVDKIAPPWVLKPRSEASATGIVKIKTKEELWIAIENLGDKRFHFLLESFKPGDVFHVDSLVYDSEICFVSASQYLSPPMEVSHDGGIFRSKTLGKKSPEFIALEEANKKVLKSFGLKHGATHTEFIRGKEDGKWYFLETSSRVGGAHIPDLVEASTGINLWREWARIENAWLNDTPYQLTKPTDLYGGLIICLSRDKNPDCKEFEAPEVYKFLPMDYHVGLVYQSDKSERIKELLDDAAMKINDHHLSIMPPKSKPTS
ncbi:ATP-grasp domain-containing protein [Kaistella antarctica]|uniref:ATPase n=1 Tax=Kaistella antarctica TaxID=266748 RepID=A0A448NP60_9FLAO|nr:ATP-grasp domain-containing protein [Kaistella antarctica]KEY19540.1 ATPase [Kaistella antarctica]SEW08143.1 ATP-grasp domain-containing protein [Kaistella antarctica]VEH97187.1 argininosuccinate lyase [Kaistella antarctica]